MDDDEEETGAILNAGDGDDDNYDDNIQLGSTHDNHLKPRGDDADSDDIIDKHKDLPQFTFRAIAGGVIVGGLMSFSNMYFGLQADWITMGSLQSTLLGFLAFRMVEKRLTRKFNYLENVLLQTVAVATATMPLAGGFIGVIPALEILWHQEHNTTVTPVPGTSSSSHAADVELPIYFSWWGLTLWSFALAFFGVFFAVPLRRQTILVEKLKFPSGTATAQMISVLHELDDSQVSEELLLKHEETDISTRSRHNSREDEPLTTGANVMSSSTSLSSSDLEEDQGFPRPTNFNTKYKVLFISFAASALYKFMSFFFPILSGLPIFGTYLANTWAWKLTPSLSYVGQGMIMGPKTGASMFVGLILGWAILGPIAHDRGWAPGKPLDVTNGAKGWLLWIALFIMLSQSIVSLLVLMTQQLLVKFGYIKRTVIKSSDDPAPINQRVPNKWWIIGLVISTISCVAIISPLFDVAAYQTLLAVLVALLTSVLAVRALGVTDMNPVTGIGKISQILFAFVAPKNIVSNLVAGAIAEAGGQQAGDMLQDLKTGHLLKASPRTQFYGQLIGSFFSIFFAVAAFKLYSSVGTINSPSSGVWLSMARLVNGGSLGDHVLPFCIVFGGLVSIIPILEAVFPSWEPYLPSGIGIAIGMYITPNYIIPRCIGSLVQFVWKRYRVNSFNDYMIIVASGFVLGEGVTSIITGLLNLAK
ncbi:hypothetical protein SAMD00019534_085080 [Acytostelium subglobosum LB1]|uniref:hypothetical protein n=1 Tax=Acytostelium subglobosum LB1 TaxID=1410327 RepID=UPI000644E373|nr:hypothetical protein SAMD00019534_085080 [Acytostelium subglobosum LB1]GAM25333.1 hypothetical protein SAMD00019534_085080 [Acytostelium subglobosum LB1]|eukprot:XP_012751853.1 hypothetical protein SAMD00019534_085080 [Acytostelium subglobosum LB1]